MKEREWSVKTPATEPIGTVYVHLCSGEVRVVANVTEMAVTDTHVILTHDDGEVAVFPRSDVYYCSDEVDAEPAAF